MAIIKVLEHIDEETGKKWSHTQYLFNCPGCGYEHAVGLKSEGGNHTFNMDLDKPTFSPSLVHDFTPGRRCHSFVKEGKIQFLNDCWHELKGQTVDLPRYEN